jgi:hypothetical protein
MSRHTSPGPSIIHPQANSFHQVLPSRQKSKAHATGIAAGAEDLKYRAKYKELKRKVREIESVCFFCTLSLVVVFIIFFLVRTMTNCISKSFKQKGVYRE